MKSRLGCGAWRFRCGAWRFTNTINTRISRLTAVVVARVVATISIYALFSRLTAVVVARVVATFAVNALFSCLTAVVTARVATISIYTYLSIIAASLTAHVIFWTTCFIYAFARTAFFFAFWSTADFWTFALAAATFFQIFFAP